VSYFDANPMNLLDSGTSPLGTTHLVAPGTKLSIWFRKPIYTHGREAEKQ